MHPASSGVRSSLINDHTPLAKNLSLRAYLHLGKKQFTKAIACFEQALRHDLKEDAAWFGLGKIYQIKERYPEAIHCFQTILTFDPQNLVTLMALGKIADHQNHIFLAQEYYERIILFNPKFIPAYDALAKNHAKQGNESYATWCLDKIQLLHHAILNDIHLPDGIFRKNSP
jgi:tetratricopeptide (TPR) repeat protein